MSLGCALVPGAIASCLVFAAATTTDACCGVRMAEATLATQVVLPREGQRSVQDD